MAITSFPAVGNGGVTPTTWAEMYTCPDGIINDVDGTGLTHTVISASNVIRMNPGMACVNGYYLLNDATFDLQVPTTAAVYFVAAMYDPTLNVAQGDGSANPAGPCRLIITTALDTSGGKAYTMILRISRAANQSLAAASIIRYAQNIGSAFSVDALPPAKLTNPESNYGGWDHPVGAVCFERSTGEVYDKVPVSGGTYWKPRSIGGPFAFPVASSTLVATGTDEVPGYYYSDSGAVVHFEGGLKRSSGANLTNGADVTLGTMPSAARPKKQVRFSCTGHKAAGGFDAVQVTVRASDGVVVLYDPGTVAFDYVDLSGVIYRTR